MTFTIAEYCQQFNDRQIIINRDYQRSPKVWPASARSALIETVLLQYPIPKILLRQRTDLKSRRTIKEVVDGQQRTLSLVDFFNSELTITQGKFAGKRFSTLEEEEQKVYLSYPLAVDLFPEATDEDIREIFRRINSYTVPLNRQELRHSVYQGRFKWFITGLTHTYAQTLKDLGVFTENQLSRMADAELLTEIIRTLEVDIESSSAAKLDELYASEFTKEDKYSRIIASAFSVILAWEDLRNSALMTRYNFYSLATAVAHALNRFPHLNVHYDFGESHPLSDKRQALVNLTSLAEAIERKDASLFSEFVTASSAATNRREPRTTRFEWMCRALLPNPLVQ